MPPAFKNGLPVFSPSGKPSFGCGGSCGVNGECGPQVDVSETFQAGCRFSGSVKWTPGVACPGDTEPRKIVDVETRFVQLCTCCEENDDRESCCDATILACLWFEAPDDGLDGLCPRTSVSPCDATDPDYLGDLCCFDPDDDGDSLNSNVCCNVVDPDSLQCDYVLGGDCKDRAVSSCATDNYGCKKCITIPIDDPPTGCCECPGLSLDLTVYEVVETPGSTYIAFQVALDPPLVNCKTRCADADEWTMTTNDFFGEKTWTQPGCNDVMLGSVDFLTGQPASARVEFVDNYGCKIVKTFAFTSSTT